MVDSAMMWTYSLLTIQAIGPIILGSFKSLKTPASVRARRKARKSPSAIPTGDESEDEEDADAELDETLSWSDTLLFPIMGSAALLGFYAILKYVGKEWINMILGVYFSGAGMFAMQSTLDTLVSFFLRTIGVKPSKYHVRISSKLRQVFHSSFTLPSLILIPISIALPALYIPLGRPYILSNAIALSLSTATLQLLRLDSFLTAGVLLGVLLIYDIFWVFATPVMVTVAKGLDAPIKLLAPRPSSTSPTGSDFAMLGLGDVVIPGLMVALCLRFDLAQYARRNPGKDIGPRSSFSRPYFWTGVISYLIGLATTMAVMTYFKTAQPALLYLSPACVIGPFLLGLIRGESSDLWAYKESDTEDVRDETIEPGSEVAQKTREAAKAKAAALADGVSSLVDGANDEKSGDDEKEGVNGEDDSWMEGGVAGSNGQEGKARKRRTKKK